MKSIFENNGGIYRNENGILIPNLKAPENNKEIGKYGNIHKQFIKQNYPAFYSALIIKGTLFDYLEKVDSMAKDEVNRLIPLLAEKHGVTEKLKEENQLKWVGLINNIKSQAEEFVLRDSVYSMEVQR